MDGSRVFEVYNARNLMPEEVAKTFVPPPVFDRLARRRNALVIGPRGSGKTTLLKMLQQPALECWENPSANEFRARVDYTAIFVPTDVVWSLQLQSFGAQIEDAGTRQLLGRSAFTTHVLRSVISAFVDRTDCDMTPRSHHHRRVPLTPEAEADIVREVSSVWLCRPRIATLRSLRETLSERLSDLARVANREARLGELGRHERLTDSGYVDLSFLPAARAAVEIFESVSGGSGHWAFLFDELEIAPSWIRDDLLMLLRSTDQKFIFKLSLSPFTVGLPKHDGAEQHDYDEIVLWYPLKEDGYHFSEALWKAMTKARYGEAIDPATLLGHPPYATQANEWAAEGTAYLPNSTVAEAFQSLATDDGSFREFLSNRTIDPSFLQEVSKDDRAKLLRKIAPLVYFRREFLASRAEAPQPSKRKGHRRSQRPGDPRAVLRTRKNATVYSGVEAVFAACEGNPRVLINVIDRLLNDYDSFGEVTEASQARVLRSAARAYSALLRTAPVPGTGGFGLFRLLRKIGRFVFNEVVRAPFNPDPPTTFVVDSDISSEVEEALGVAVNMGAIVYLPDKDAELVLKSLRSKRFRLSYLLALNFTNPMRIGRPISLSEILRRSSSDDEGDQLPIHFGDT